MNRWMDCPMRDERQFKSRWTRQTDVHFTRDCRNECLLFYVISYFFFTRALRHNPQLCADRAEHGFAVCIAEGLQQNLPQRRVNAVHHTQLAEKDIGVILV